MVIVPIKRIVKESSREIETTNERERKWHQLTQKSFLEATHLIIAPSAKRCGMAKKELESQVCARLTLASEWLYTKLLPDAEASTAASAFAVTDYSR